jgi:hypothetical protein
MTGVRRRLTPGARASGSLLLAALLPTVGCGGTEPLPDACVEARAADVHRALAAAPRARLADGTPLSRCVDLAVRDVDLQTLGVAFVTAADELAREIATRRGAAFRLGVLIGAAERGAGPTGGPQAELVRRLRQVVSFQPRLARHRSELMRGIALGRRRG